MTGEKIKKSKLKNIILEELQKLDERRLMNYVLGNVLPEVPSTAAEQEAVYQDVARQRREKHGPSQTAGSMTAAEYNRLKNLERGTEGQDYTDSGAGEVRFDVGPYAVDSGIVQKSTIGGIPSEQGGREVAGSSFRADRSPLLNDPEFPAPKDDLYVGPQSTYVPPERATAQSYRTPTFLEKHPTLSYAHEFWTGGTPGRGLPERDFQTLRPGPGALGAEVIKDDPGWMEESWIDADPYVDATSGGHSGYYGSSLPIGVRGSPEWNNISALVPTGHQRLVSAYKAKAKELRERDNEAEALKYDALATTSEENHAEEANTIFAKAVAARFRQLRTHEDYQGHFDELWHSDSDVYELAKEQVLNQMRGEQNAYNMRGNPGGVYGVPSSGGSGLGDLVPRTIDLPGTKQPPMGEGEPIMVRNPRTGELVPGAHYESLSGDGLTPIPKGTQGEQGYLDTEAVLNMLGDSSWEYAAGELPNDPEYRDDLAVKMLTTPAYSYQQDPEIASQLDYTPGAAEQSIEPSWWETGWGSAIRDWWRDEGMLTSGQDAVRGHGFIFVPQVDYNPSVANPEVGASLMMSHLFGDQTDPDVKATSPELHRMADKYAELSEEFFETRLKATDEGTYTIDNEKLEDMSGTEIQEKWQEFILNKRTAGEEIDNKLLTFAGAMAGEGNISASEAVESHRELVQEYTTQTSEYNKRQAWKIDQDFLLDRAFPVRFKNHRDAQNYYNRQRAGELSADNPVEGEALTFSFRSRDVHRRVNQLNNLQSALNRITNGLPAGSPGERNRLIDRYENGELKIDENMSINHPFANERGAPQAALPPWEGENGGLAQTLKRYYEQQEQRNPGQNIPPPSEEWLARSESEWKRIRNQRSQPAPVTNVGRQSLEVFGFDPTEPGSARLLMRELKGLRSRVYRATFELAHMHPAGRTGHPNPLRVATDHPAFRRIRSVDTRVGDDAETWNVEWNPDFYNLSRWKLEPIQDEHLQPAFERNNKGARDLTIPAGRLVFDYDKSETGTGLEGIE